MISIVSLPFICSNRTGAPAFIIDESFTVATMTWLIVMEYLQLQLCGTTFRTISELKTVSTTLKV
jgi:hypothetical protein